MFDIENIQNDLRSFADDESEFVIERNGEFLFNRFGKEIQCTIKKDRTGNLYVNTGDQDLPYLTFVSKELARLELFADKLMHKYPSSPNFIDGPATLDSASDVFKKNRSLELLSEITDNPLPFMTRVVFITADAGQGKTMLLREMQFRIAKKFLSKQSNYLFWHVDLQGRQLLRLNEALLGDLGELRITGLYMQSIITLLRYGLIVLAIDGFDELAAEQGSSDALGALSHLVKQLKDSGTIIAASRRTFFDAEEYIKRTRILSSTVSSSSQFDQLRLCFWSRNEDIKYLNNVDIDGKRFPNPEEVYSEILRELKDDQEHPMLSRPFLLAQIAKGLLLYGLSPSNFIGKMTNPLESVASVLLAFIDREVTQKWRMRETNEPYLTQDQHLALLSNVAEEIWQSQQEKIRFELVEELLTLLMDEWQIVHNRRPQIINMVKMHVLLIAPDGDYAYRKFEHPEFKNYFISYILKDIINSLSINDIKDRYIKFLSIAQLPDSVPKYTASMIEKKPELIIQVLKCFKEMVNKEWRPTYLQTNIGTIIPYLISNVEFHEQVIIDLKIVYSSLIFENSQIRNVSFKNGQFINNSFCKIEWENMVFEDCEFNDPVFDYNSTINNVNFINCKFSSVTICKEEEEVLKEYSPERIKESLISINFGFQEEAAPTPIVHDPFDDTIEKKILIKFINIFKKTTRITSNVLKIKFTKEQQPFLFDVLIPIAEQTDILKETKWEGGGNAKSWQLTVRVEDIFRNQNIDDKITNFWERIIRTVLNNR